MNKTDQSGKYIKRMQNNNHPPNCTYKKKGVIKYRTNNGNVFTGMHVS